MKSGQLRFSHPSGTRDDSLWALALAIYASRPERPIYHPAVLTRYIVKPIIDYSFAVPPKKVKRPPVPGEWPMCMACGQYRKKGCDRMPAMRGNPDKSTWTQNVPDPWEAQNH